MADAAPNAGSSVQMSRGVSKTPAEFLKAIKGMHVLVKLNSGVDYRGEARGAVQRAAGPIADVPSFLLRAGVLACLDGYMNIAMEQTEVSAERAADRRQCLHGIAHAQLHACMECRSTSTGN